MINKIILTIACIAVPFVSMAQVDGSLEALFKNNRKGKYQFKEITTWLQKNPLPKQEIYNYALEGKNGDPYFTFQLVYQEALISHSVSVKEDNIYFLINYGLSGEHKALEKNIISYLTEFDDSLFTAQSRSTIASKIMQSEGGTNELIKLSGKLGVTDLIPHYESLLIDQKTSNVLKWNISLALGRMGDIDHVKACVNKVRKIGLNDQVVFGLVPDLIYLNNRLAYDYILEQILSDEKRCTSTNPDNEVSINCAYRLMEMIAPYIFDFPVQLYESGDIITEDYSQTLQKVRQWIIDNNYMYEIN